MADQRPGMRMPNGMSGGMAGGMPANMQANMQANLPANMQANMQANMAGMMPINFLLPESYFLPNMAQSTDFSNVSRAPWATSSSATTFPHMPGSVLMPNMFPMEWLKQHAAFVNPQQMEHHGFPSGSMGASASDAQRMIMQAASAVAANAANAANASAASAAARKFSQQQQTTAPSQSAQQQVSTPSWTPSSATRAPSAGNPALSAKSTAASGGNAASGSSGNTATASAVRQNSASAQPAAPSPRKTPRKGQVSAVTDEFASNVPSSKPATATGGAGGVSAGNKGSTGAKGSSGNAKDGTSTTTSRKERSSGAGSKRSSSTANKNSSGEPAAKSSARSSTTSAANRDAKGASRRISVKRYPVQSMHYKCGSTPSDFPIKGIPGHFPDPAIVNVREAPTPTFQSYLDAPRFKTRISTGLHRRISGLHKQLCLVSGNGPDGHETDAPENDEYNALLQMLTSITETNSDLKEQVNLCHAVLTNCRARKQAYRQDMRRVDEIMTVRLQQHQNSIAEMVAKRGDKSYASLPAHVKQLTAKNTGPSAANQPASRRRSSGVKGRTPTR
ncbi:uncharacterized protein MONBRDRAFT_34560 [Monosiga brevicollis MX1]|uniref:Uncharacterized protein n=1 Tax=Monosiga brevicollis TaxID=81824 RepID=A9VCJ4_MONBE|nr:uncharacterized protein MONBRDRAFT_34560 [Monosiga brevicollis MX1]EDQ84796.1 predicted protein [Monosiga brevicollis MX1]|eukprot:XP_001750446.1 hypothetical protein [Monosiga brevicollis MX1]